MLIDVLPKEVAAHLVVLARPRVRRQCLPRQCRADRIQGNFQRFAERHGAANWFESMKAAQAWAQTFAGSCWLEVRDVIARVETTAPMDNVVAG